LNNLQDVPLWELKLCFIGLLPTYLLFSIYSNINFVYEALLCYISEKYVTPILKSTYLENLNILHNVPLWELNLHFIGLLSITIFDLKNHSFVSYYISGKHVTWILIPMSLKGCMLYNIPFWQFSVHFIGFLSISYHFQMEETFISLIIFFYVILKRNM
jgi:hypothetical protein